MSLSYDPDAVPDCPDCGTDVFVDAVREDRDAYRCHLCQWVSDE